MPEGHSVHRIARQFALHFVGRAVAVSSPAGAVRRGRAELDGRTVTDCGPWASRCSSSSTTACGCACTWACTAPGTSPATSPPTRRSRRRTAGWGRPTSAARTSTRRSRGRGEDSLHLIGAPRRTRVRMAEQKRGSADDVRTFPPEPVGAGAGAAADRRTRRRPARADRVRGADARAGAASIAKLGPDPLVDDSAEARGALHGRRAQEADADRAAAHGPVGGQRHRQRLPRRAAVPRAAEPAHARASEVPEEIVRAALAGLGAAAARSGSRPAR